MKSYLTVKEETITEIVIKKSQFITKIFPVTSEEEAIECLAGERKEHYKATHNCYAYVIGENSETVKFSDDGEPAQTAGKPIYSVMQHRKITNALIVVTRYFGGIKLGAGGLVRAYSQAASSVLDACVGLECIYSDVVNFKVDYSFYGKLSAEINNLQYNTGDVIYANDVDVTVYVPKEETESFIASVYDLSNGMYMGQVMGEKLFRKEVKV